MSDVTIVVVTYNSRACLPRLKQALETQSHNSRLIVLDNASTPDQRPTPKDLPSAADFIQSETNLGFAAGNNLCVARVDTPFVALLNPDAFPEPDWLARLMAAAEQNPRVAAFGSTQISANDPTRFDGLGDAYHAVGTSWRGGFGAPTAAHTPRTGQTFSACAAAALYRTEAWRAVEGFDEALFCFAEDVDLAFRLRLRGWQVMQIGDAVVRHIGGASAAAHSDFATFHNARNTIRVFVKDMPSALFWLMALAHALKTLAHYAASFARAEGASYRRGVRAGIMGLAAAWRARRAVQATREAPVRHIAAALTWSPLALLRRAPKIWR